MTWTKQSTGGGGGSTTSPLNGKIWGVLGDSISQPSSSDSVLKYYDYIAQRNNMTAYSYAVGGMGYTVTPSGNQTIQEQITKMTQPNYDYISVLAGTNDQTTIGTISDAANDGTTGTISGAIRGTIEALINKWPMAKIFIMTSTPASDKYKNYGVMMNWQNAQNLTSISQNVVDICKMYSIPCLDLYLQSGLKPWNSTFQTQYFKSDGLHPTTAGHQLISYKIENFMLSL